MLQEFTHYWDVSGFIALVAAFVFLVILLILIFENPHPRNAKEMIAFSAIVLALVGVGVFSFAQGTAIGKDTDKTLTEALAVKYNLTVETPMANFSGINSSTIHEATNSNGDRIIFKLTFNEDRTDIYAYSQANEVEVAKSPTN